MYLPDEQQRTFLDVKRWIPYLNIPHYEYHPKDKNMYRTHTPTTHVWYQSKKRPSHHIWIAFSGSLIYVKIGIRVIEKQGSSWNTRILEPDPSYFREHRTFSDGIRAVEYILSSNM